MGKGTVIALGKDWWKTRRAEAPTDVNRIALARRDRPATQTEFLKVKEVAERLRVSYGHILEEIHNGSLIAQPMKKGYLVAAHEVDAYLERLRLNVKHRAG